MIRLKDGFSGERAIVVPQLVVGMMERDPLLAQLHITDIGFYPKAAHHFRERPTPVDQYIFIYCIDGKGWYTTGQQTCHVEPNQYFIIPAGVPHTYGADEHDPWTIYWIHFKGLLAPHYVVPSLRPQHIDLERHSRISHRINLFEEIYSAIAAGFSLDNMHYAAATFHHYLGTLRYLRQYRAAGRADAGGDIVGRAVHFMKENIGRHLRIAELAKLAGCSESGLTKAFKLRTGHAPLNYFNMLKIQLACQLLDTTQMKVSQICYKVGIDDMFYFSRLFSKIMGTSPSAYRKMGRG